MPNWKKVIISGSDAALNSLLVTTSVTASNISASGDIYTDTLIFNTGSDHSVGGGQVGWNTADGTLNIGLEDGVMLQAGQELHVRAKAQGAISNGDAVMFVGAQGDHILVSTATQAVLNANPEYFVGIATHNLSNNEFGYIATFGLVRELDTDTPAWDPGTVLWFDSEGVTAGALTSTQPSAPYAQIRVAAVTRRNPAEGVILVRPDRLPKLNDLQDVQHTTPDYGDLIMYNSSSEVWENTKTLSGSYTIDNGDLNVDGSITGSDVQIDDWGSVSASLAAATLTNPITGTGTTNYVSKFTGANTLGNSLIFDNGTNVGIGTTSPNADLSVGGYLTVGNAGLRQGSITIGSVNDSLSAFMGTFETSAATNNTIVGGGAMYQNITGSNNTSIGALAGALFGPTYSGVATGINSGIYIGYLATPSAISNSNEIVIGVGAVGAGSNTTTLGNDFTTTTILKGDTGIGTTSPSEKLDVNGNIKLSETAATTDTDKFVVLDSGVLKYRTGTQLLSDIGAGTGTVTGTGTTNYISKWTSTTAQGNSQIFDNGTNVGIGTTSPDTLLHLSSASPIIKLTDTNTNASSQINANSGAGSLFIEADTTSASANSVIGFKVDGSEKMRIEDDGNVGIGTTSPNNNLHIKTDTNGDGVTIQRDSTSNGAYADLMFSITDTDSASPATKIRAIRGTSYGDTDMLFITDTDEAMRIDSSGRVGIGTSTITEKLHVNGSTGVDTAVRVDTTNADAELKLTVLGQKDWTLGVDYSDSGKFKITDSGTVGTSPRFTIDTSGDVGIGTTSPLAKLHVDNGTSGTTTITNTSSDYSFYTDAVQTNTYQGLLGTGEGSTVTAAIHSFDDGSGAAQGLIFSTGNNTTLSERIRINSSGDVGIGTTSPDDKLHVNGGNLRVEGGDILLENTIISNQDNLDVDTGTETVAEISSTIYTAAFFDYVIKNGTNLRAGTVFACHDGSSNVEYTETSTNDLGDTSDVALKVDISGGNIRLTATTTSDNWSVKSLVRGL